MTLEYVAVVVWVLFLAGTLAYAVIRHQRRKRLPYSFRPRSFGPGTIGAVWDLLNEDQRHTMEIIVEQHTEERRPEYPDISFP